MAERILIDTGPIVAILCREDAEHEPCVEYLRTLNGELYTCWPVISEVVFLLEGRADRIQSLLKMLATHAIRIGRMGAEMEIVAWLTGFYGRFGEHAPDLADTNLIYLSERHQVQKIFTLDVRDFSIYRLQTVKLWRSLARLSESTVNPNCGLINFAEKELSLEDVFMMVTTGLVT